MVVRNLSILQEGKALMTTPPAVYGQFGQTLHFAERTLTAFLHEHLARRGTKPETYYGLRLIAIRGRERDRDALIEELDASRNVDEPARGVLARLEADGLIRGDALVELTEEGEARFGDLRAYVTGPTIELLSQFDLDDIETTVRTLQAITERASEDST
jgi:hypothetical protein